MLIKHKRLLALAVSSLFSLCGLRCFLLFQSPDGTVQEVNIGKGLRALLESRLRSPTEEVDLVDDRGDPILVREPVPEEVARVLFPALRRRHGRAVYDSSAFFVSTPHHVVQCRFPEHPEKSWELVTNDRGFRKNVNVRRTKPELRILITGDSHTEGVVPVHESFSDVLEAKLNARYPNRAIESLNAGKGGYSFYNYVGVLERNLDLDPDIFVMAVYGGNDFVDVLPLAHYFHRLPPLPRIRIDRARVEKANLIAPGLVSQGLRQAWYFHRNPQAKELAMHVALAATLEASRLCRDTGRQFLCVYIPSPLEVRSHLPDGSLSEILEVLEIPRSALESNIALADTFIDAVSARGVEVIDMRSRFGVSTEPLYWSTDQHINSTAHRMVAETLTEVIAPLAKTSREW